MMQRVDAMEYCIRPATQADIEFCTALESSCFSEPWSEKAFVQAMLDESTCFYVIEYNDRPAGYYVAGNICDEVNLYTIAVDSSYRNKGLASKLVQHLIDKSKDVNAFMIGLEVRVSNQSAIHLYEKFKFKQCGLRPNFYRKPTEDALLYTLYLNEETI